MKDLSNIWVFRMIAVDNLQADLTNGLFAKLNAPFNVNRVTIGNAEIINERDKRKVTCFPNFVVNNFVPFYFAVKTPMLFNIYTGHGTTKINQSKIVYLCVPLMDFVNGDVEWCFTDGNAAKVITNYYTKIADLTYIDWRSIASQDFRLDNADGDEDRIRKKHAEFLVKDYVPSHYIKGIIVYDKSVKADVSKIVQSLHLTIDIRVKRDFYF